MAILSKSGFRRSGTPLRSNPWVNELPLRCSRAFGRVTIGGKSSYHSRGGWHVDRGAIQQEGLSGRKTRRPPAELGWGRQGGGGAPATRRGKLNVFVTWLGLVNAGRGVFVLRSCWKEHRRRGRKEPDTDIAPNTGLRHG